MIRKSLLGSVAAGGLLAMTLPASADDLAVATMPAVVPVPIYTWAGLYAGGNLGGAWSNRNNWFNDPAIYPADIGFPNGFGCGAPSCNSSRSGVTGGGQIGFNLQSGIWLWGLEGDVEYLGNGRQHNNVTVAFTLPPVGARSVVPGAQALGPGTYTAFLSGDDGSNVIGTIRGRLGVAWDRWLVYGTGGVAIRGSDNVTAFVNGPGGVTVASSAVVNNTAGGTTTGYGCSASNDPCRNADTVGWVAGGGLQYAITNNVSLGVEYLHADFGGATLIDPILLAYYGTSATSTVNRGDWVVDIVRARLDFKFGLFGPQ